MSQACGCRVEHHEQDGQGGFHQIIFCPPHAATEELRAAVKAQHRALDWCLATIARLDSNFFPSKSPAWEAVERGHRALAHAEGR